MIERLAEDHLNARLLADGLAGMDGIIDLDPARVTTNYVVFRVRPRAAQSLLEARATFTAELARRGVLCLEVSQGQVRALTHYGIERADIDRTLATVRESLAAVGLASVVA